MKNEENDDINLNVSKRTKLIDDYVVKESDLENEDDFSKNESDKEQTDVKSEHNSLKIEEILSSIALSQLNRTVFLLKNFIKRKHFLSDSLDSLDDCFHQTNDESPLFNCYNQVSNANFCFLSFSNFFLELSKTF